tara:strand:+ start:156 stop:527 length:372 start_codon:yes stop_codon:yes gene_type:complete
LNKKEKFIEAYKKTFGNITQSAEACGVHRQTYYDWCNADEDFKKEIEALQPDERFLDFAESKLVKKMNEGDTASIIFALKTKGKKRGYVERVEQTGKDGGPVEITGITYVTPNQDANKGSTDV